MNVMRKSTFTATKSFSLFYFNLTYIGGKENNSNTSVFAKDDHGP